MKRRLKIDLGINGAFITRRWEEPKNWMRLTREMGYEYHEFCADVLDPFFSGSRAYQMETAIAVREAAEKYGVGIIDIYTGVATHRFHGLAHSDPSVRQRMKDWIIESMDLALAMGTDRVGGHWDALSVEVLSNPDLKKAAVRRLHDTFRGLSRIAASKGLKGLYVEQMYIPSEVPWTLKQSEEYLVATNRDNEGVPIRLTVDTGHMAGGHYGLEGRDLCYEEWIRCFGAGCEVIHIQQTTRDASKHWPFTPAYNEQGEIAIEEVLEALRWSHEHYRDQRWSEYLEPAERTTLILEAIPGSTTTEKELLSDYGDSSQYLRRFVPEGGLEWEFGV